MFINIASICAWRAAIVSSFTTRSVLVYSINSPLELLRSPVTVMVFIMGGRAAISAARSLVAAVCSFNPMGYLLVQQSA